MMKKSMILFLAANIVGEAQAVSIPCVDQETGGDQLKEVTCLNRIVSIYGKQKGFLMRLKHRVQKKPVAEKEKALRDIETMFRMYYNKVVHFNPRLSPGGNNTGIKFKQHTIVSLHDAEKIMTTAMKTGGFAKPSQPTVEKTKNGYFNAIQYAKKVPGTTSATPRTVTKVEKAR